LIERIPSVVKKDKTNALLKDLLELIFKLMIDIDDEVDADWLRPKDGHTVEEEEENNVKVG